MKTLTQLPFYSLVLLLLTLSCSGLNDDSTWSARDISSTSSDYYTDQVKPILDNRCVACHSCYNSPCQLNLASFEGLERGANKKEIYKFNKLIAQKTTRLFEDATSAKQWQKEFNFFPVIRKSEDGQVDLLGSAFFHMINLKATNPKLTGNFQSELSRSCPKVKTTFSPTGGMQIKKYIKKTPWGGMPYGLPALKPAEQETLLTWLNLGAQGPMQSLKLDINASKIAKWEKFLNNKDPKHVVSARYIYEHLFIAHIYLDDDTDNFYKLVRAKNRTGKPEVIPTRRPYSPTKETFYYRLSKITSTIVHKTHIVYPFNQEKLARYKELFIDSDWGNEEIVIPSYKLSKSANPLVTFKQIPAKSRYKFLLDNAQYHIMTFIRGPVCKGKVALNVIDDHFWVMFLDPESDIFVNNKEALDTIAPLATTPARFGSNVNPSAILFYKQKMTKKSKLRIAKNKELDKYKLDGYSINDLWDGEGYNDNALLTVFRHFDSSSVVKGALGSTPKTVWVLDYPILEDIYYNLVAGYDVYGASTHQVKTRIHMDNARVNSQDNFIDMLPLNARGPLRFEWARNEKSVYDEKSFALDPSEVEKFNPFSKSIRKLDAAKKMERIFPYLGSKRKTQESFSSPNTKEEILNRILSKRFSKIVRGPLDKINGTPNTKSGPVLDKIYSYKSFEKEASKVFGEKSYFNTFFPDLMLIRIANPDGEDKVYSLIHNKAHWNVSYMISETTRRRWEEDTLAFIPGFIGSYPNYILKVEFKDLSTFLKTMKEISSRESYDKLIKTYGINRMSDNFWNEYDFMNSHLKKTNPLEAGILDLNRYENY